MPITQDRMIELIQAGEDLYHCWKALRDRVHELAPFDPSVHIYTPRPESLMTVAREQSHFKSNASRNDIKRRQMRRRRGTATEDDMVRNHGAKRDVMAYIARQRADQGLAAKEATFTIEIDPMVATPESLANGIFGPAEPGPIPTAEELGEDIQAESIVACLGCQGNGQVDGVLCQACEGSGYKL